MALHQLLCGVTAVILLSTRGSCQTHSPSAHSPPTHSPPTHSPPTHSPPTHSPPALPKCGMWRYDFPSKNPFMVRLHNDQGHLCAGSLINEEWLLTAAHCVSQHQAKDITVAVGYLGYEMPKREVDRVECHPHYNSYTDDNDICLLKLSHPVEFNDYVQPVCLPSAESTFHTGTRSLVTGWGITDTGGQYSYFLQESIVGNNECRCTYPNLTENMMCAKGTCEGEGLLLTIAFGQWIGTGIWSFGKESCQGPPVYTRLSQYEDFIRMVTTKHTNYTTSSYGNDSLPEFITTRSMGNDSDSHFTCPTAPPHTTEGGKGGGSIFDSGENLIRFSHFTHFFSLGGFLVLSFYALV